MRGCRLAGVVITVPPLSERRVDIPLLARRFAAEVARDCAHDICLSHGGGYMYVPKDQEFELTKRDREIFDRATRQLQELPYYHTFTHKSHPSVIELSERLIGYTEGRMAKVFFTNSGNR